MGECQHVWSTDDGAVETCGAPACDITGYCDMHEEFHGDAAEKLREELDRVRQVSNTYHTDLVKERAAHAATVAELKARCKNAEDTASFLAQFQNAAEDYRRQNTDLRAEVERLRERKQPNVLNPRGPAKAKRYEPKARPVSMGGAEMVESEGGGWVPAQVADDFAEERREHQATAKLKGDAEEEATRLRQCWEDARQACLRRDAKVTRAHGLLDRVRDAFHSDAHASVWVKLLDEIDLEIGEPGEFTTAVNKPETVKNPPVVNPLREANRLARQKLQRRRDEIATRMPKETAVAAVTQLDYALSLVEEGE